LYSSYTLAYKATIKGVRRGEDEGAKRDEGAKLLTIKAANTGGETDED